MVLITGCLARPEGSADASIAIGFLCSEILDTYVDGYKPVDFSKLSAEQGKLHVVLNF